MLEQLTYYYGRTLNPDSVTLARKRFKSKFGYNATTVFFHKDEIPENVLIMAGLEVKEADWTLLKYHFAVMRIES